MAVAGDPTGYYRALGIERTASADAVKTAFRQRAKSLHPDQGGGVADQELFRLLVEAYEVLRDPQQRLRYDTDSLAAERGGFAHGAATEAAPANDDPAAADPWRRAGSFAVTHATTLLTGALILSVCVAALGWTRASERERTIAELTHRPEAAAPAPLVAGADPPRLYRTVFRFPAGVAELDPAARDRLAGVTADLRRQIAALPGGSEWLIGVEGVIERAADGDGLLVAAWELALLRVGVTAQYLVGQGIPAERVSVRFHAGALAPGQGRGQRHGVALSLFCCLPEPLGG